MNSEDSGAEQRLVVPGDQIDAPPGSQPGSGVMSQGDNFVATKLGRVKINGDVVHVFTFWTLPPSERIHVLSESIQTLFLALSASFTETDLSTMLKR